MCFGRQLCIKLLFMNLVLIKLVFLMKLMITHHMHTLLHVTKSLNPVKLHSHQLCFFSMLSYHSLNMYQCIVLHFPFIVNELSFLVHPPLQFMIFSHTTLAFFPFQAFKLLVNGPKRKLTRSSTKSEKGETSKSPMQETPTSFIPLPLTSLEVPKNWFKNHTAFGRWIDTFKHRSLFYVDILECNFFLFEDFEIVSSFIQTTPG